MSIRFRTVVEQSVADTGSASAGPLVRARRVSRDGPDAATARRSAVLFDRDDTLIEDVPYNGDPAAVVARPGAREAVDRLRRARFLLGMVSNQSGVARGLITEDDVHRVNQRVEELVGPLDVVVVCPHGERDGCSCRKPAPGMILAAAAVLGVPATSCVVVGDIGADVEAARAAGARAILVPTARTLTAEVFRAARLGQVADDLAEAVDRILSRMESSG